MPPRKTVTPSKLRGQCPHCDATGMLPPAKRGEAIKCPKCALLGVWVEPKRNTPARTPTKQVKAVESRQAENRKPKISWVRIATALGVIALLLTSNILGQLSGEESERERQNYLKTDEAKKARVNPEPVISRNKNAGTQNKIIPESDAFIFRDSSYLRAFFFCPDMKIAKGVSSALIRSIITENGERGPEYKNFRKMFDRPILMSASVSVFSNYDVYLVACTLRDDRLAHANYWTTLGDGKIMESGPPRDMKYLKIKAGSPGVVTVETTITDADDPRLPSLFAWANISQEFPGVQKIKFLPIDGKPFTVSYQEFRMFGLLDAYPGDK